MTCLYTDHQSGQEKVTSLLLCFHKLDLFHRYWDLPRNIILKGIKSVLIVNVASQEHERQNFNVKNIVRTISNANENVWNLAWVVWSQLALTQDLKLKRVINARKKLSWLFVFLPMLFSLSIILLSPIVYSFTWITLNQSSVYSSTTSYIMSHLQITTLFRKFSENEENSSCSKARIFRVFVFIENTG